MRVRIIKNENGFFEVQRYFGWSHGWSSPGTKPWLYPTQQAAEETVKELYGRYTYVVVKEYKG